MSTETPVDSHIPSPDNAPNETADSTSPGPAPIQAIEHDLMRLAQMGALREIQQLFDTGRYTAKSTDKEGITPLHWAALNGHYAVCHFLIQSGADVNARGGMINASPILWAQRRGKVELQHLMLDHGADPMLKDDQGWNLLHMAAKEGHVLLLILCFQQANIDIDCADKQGCTPLMLAAHHGFPACVSVLLRAGANANSKDEQGHSPLHWALTKRSIPCIQYLLEHGADRFAVDNDGQDLVTAARTFNGTPQWYKALSYAGYDDAGRPIKLALPFDVDPQTFLYISFLVSPFFIIGLSAFVASCYPAYIGLPASFAVSLGSQFALQRALRWAPHGMRSLQKTPFLAGVFLGTLAWSGIMWVTRILPRTASAFPLANLMFALAFGLTAYFHTLSMLSDPGYTISSSDKVEVKATVYALIADGVFDARHFCTVCMTRKPLRSKHCKMCNKCVARHDHHCPWVANCIGVNNHVHFVCYLLSLFTGAALLSRLLVAYVMALPEPLEYHCSVLPDVICAQYSKDPFGILTIGWGALQITWVTMLMLVQLSQIARALTTFEVMRGTDTGPIVTALATGAITPAGAQVDTAGMGPETDDSASHSHRAKAQQGCWSTWKRLLGVDTCMVTARHGRRVLDGQDASTDPYASTKNPYSRGILRNCQDFWCSDGGAQGLLRKKQNGLGLLGGQEVDYTQLYDLSRVGQATHRGGYRSVSGGDVEGL